MEVGVDLYLRLSDERERIDELTAVDHLVDLLEQLRAVLANHVLHDQLNLSHALLLQSKDAHTKDLSRHLLPELLQSLPLPTGSLLDLSHAGQNIRDPIHAGVELVALLMAAVLQRLGQQLVKLGVVRQPRRQLIK